MQKDFSIFIANGKKLILRRVERKLSKIHNAIPQPNFRGTGLALCGYIELSDDEDQFIEKYLAIKGQTE